MASLLIQRPIFASTIAAILALADAICFIVLPVFTRLRHRERSEAIQSRRPTILWIAASLRSLERKESVTI
jgi:hypothetical protein